MSTARDVQTAIKLACSAHKGQVDKAGHDYLKSMCGDMGYEVLAPIVELCEGRFYMTRGTRAHVGPSGVEEERLAKRLGAKPNEIIDQPFRRYR